MNGTLPLFAEELDQYFTPTWAAELLIQRHFPTLCGRDLVLDPSCGDGRFLLAVPEQVPAFGVEIEPATAQHARANTGREIITGDFLSVTIDYRPTAIVGNPPFVTKLIDDFMRRFYEMLEYGGRVGLILPAYYFQHDERVAALARRWSIAQEMIPRTLFDGLRAPLVFATFTKEKVTTLSGFFLYLERAALRRMRDEFRLMFVGNAARAGVWREVVYAALRVNGGRATLQVLYATMENHRPTENPWWREKIRQTAGKYFHRVRDGEYSLQEVAA
jgi:adenine-specific DNA-methyltransferase